MVAVEEGVEHIILGLGGSASNDSGCGLVSACGVRFTDASGTVFVPAGGSLQQIGYIDTTRLDKQ